MTVTLLVNKFLSDYLPVGLDMFTWVISILHSCSQTLVNKLLSARVAVDTYRKVNCNCRLVNMSCTAIADTLAVPQQGRRLK